MRIGKVVGNLISTVKDESLTGVKLLVVKLEEEGNGRCLIAADALHTAGCGDMVYLLSSKEGAESLGIGMTAVDAAVAGIVDEWKGDL